MAAFQSLFFASSERFWKRWSLQHRELILREDLRDLSRIVEFDKVEGLLHLLGPTIGSTVSNANLAKDLETTPKTVGRWLLELNKVQLIFPLAPYFKNIRRAMRKEKKWYFHDWRAAGDAGFENYIAASLWRSVTLWRDRYGEQFSLHYLRTHDKTEVDFLIALDGAPWLLVEAKEGDPEPTRGIRRFTNELGIPVW